MIMGNALFIIWRESAEAMLVVGVLYAWLQKHPDRPASSACCAVRCAETRLR
jgi:hypothetical protein